MLSYAFKFIMFDRAKSFGALMGVVISTFLIGQQSGIFLFLTDSMSRLVDNTKTDIWVVDGTTTNVNALANIDIRKQRELMSIPGVAAAYPIVLGSAAAKFSDGTSAGIQLIGSEAPAFRAGPPRLAGGRMEDLIPEGAVSFDRFDRPALGGADVGTTFEIGGKRARLAAYTEGVRGFGAVYMFTTLERARYYGNVPTDRISGVLVDVVPGADPAVVRDAINQRLYGVRAWLPKDFSSATKLKVLSSTGIAISIGTLLVFATISGFFIIGLTLYSAAVDRMRDYGTLKAIGATNGYITRLIFLQAMLFAVFGYTLGTLLTEGFRNGIAQAGTIFTFSWQLRLGFFVLTSIICMSGAVFAIRRINGVEPAMVFRG